jgi:hypothetical protein
MKEWLEREQAVSTNLREAIKGSMENCGVVLDDLEEHVAKVRPGDGSLTLWFGKRLKHLWNADIVAKQEARLHLQLQTVMHLINFVKL